jgi:hypothetical protein
MNGIWQDGKFVLASTLEERLARSNALLKQSEARAKELFEALDGQIAGGISGKFNGIFTRDKYRDHFMKDGDI